MSLPGVMLSWQEGAELAGLLVVVATAVRHTRLRSVGPWPTLTAVAQEAALVSLLYAIWQLAHSVAVTHVAGGVRHGQQVWDLERSLHLPSEASVQALFLPHPGLVRAANLYYAGVHFPATLLTLAWVFLFHRERYRTFRTTLALATAMSLLIQLVPVAPPRLLPVGMVDTALRYGQSVYGAGGTGVADQLGAMPSVHVLWALLVGGVVLTATRSRWRWLVLLHTVGTIVVVVLTANHFWLDGVVAAGLIGLALLLQVAARAATRRRRPGAEAPATPAGVLPDRVPAPA